MQQCAPDDYLGHFRIEMVGSDVPTTGRKHLDQPSNLDFPES